jgi:hypothetical protein
VDWIQPALNRVLGMGSSEHGNEPSELKRSGNFLYKLSDYQFRKFSNKLSLM